MATNSITGHGICHMRRVSLIQALRLKTKGLNLHRGINPVKVAKEDYPGIRGRTAAAVLAQLEALDVCRCHCEEGRKAATEQGIPETDPVFVLHE